MLEPRQPSPTGAPPHTTVRSTRTRLSPPGSSPAAPPPAARPTGTGAATRAKVLTGLLLAAVLAGYLAPRLVGLDRLVTADERFWLGRSANFYQALGSGDFAATYQFAHPGVTTMWAGTIGFALAFPEYADAHPRQVRNVDDIHEVLLPLGGDPLDVLVAARVVKLLFQAALLALAFSLARPVFGTPITVVGTFLVAFDPFLIGHDRLLHVDSLFALTAFVSLLALARLTLPGAGARYLVLSGVFAGLAWLTRTPGVLLVPVAGVVLAGLAWGQQGTGEGRVRHAARGAARAAAIWGAAAVATTFLLWPALWVDPVTVGREVLAWSRGAAAGGHEAATFFNGETHRGDPGLTYYPVSLLWRLTPVTILGLLVLLAGLALRPRAMLPRCLWAPVAILAGFALLDVVGMSLGAKKFDRYILPAYPPLDLLAAVGIVGGARLVVPGRHGLRRLPRLLASAAVAGLIAAQLASSLAVAPYYLPYFNPLLGGGAGAEEALLLGWGEGLDQVAGFIRSQPEGEDATVQMSNTRTTLLYLMPPTARVTSNAYGVDMASVVDWAETDYYVAYVSQWQRGFYSRPIDYLGGFPPVHSVRLGGAEFARTYHLNAIPPPTEMLQHPCAFAFDDDVQLVAYADARQASTMGDNTRRLRLYFVSGDRPRDRYEVRVDLLPRSPHVAPLAHRATLHPSATSGMLSHVDIQLALPGERSTKSYVLRVSVLDRATARPLPATHVSSGESGDRAVLPRCD